MENLKVFGHLVGTDELDGTSVNMPISPEDVVLLEGPGGTFSAFKEAWFVDVYHGYMAGLDDMAEHNGVSPDEMRRHLREQGVDGAGDPVTGGGDAGDILGELDTDPGQNSVRKTIRNLDQGAIDFIRGVTGASSDAEAVRKAVALAEHMLVQD